MSFLAAERNTQTIFPVENGNNFSVESENVPDTPMETLKMHPTNAEDARNRASQSQTCRVLAETPSALCNGSIGFVAAWILGQFSEIFSEKRCVPS